MKPSVMDQVLYNVCTVFVNLSIIMGTSAKKWQCFKQTEFSQNIIQMTKLPVKSKVHYASWSETCSLAHASEQVSDRFDGVCNKLATFSG